MGVHEALNCQESGTAGGVGKGSVSEQLVPWGPRNKNC
jgi:hypothetical protein